MNDTKSKSENQSERAGHTPGPWHLSRHFTYVRKAYESPGEGPKDYNICTMAIAMPTGVNEANARLIASSPNLLAFVREIRDALDGRYDGARDSKTLWMGEYLDVANKLIAAAEGR